MPHRCNYGAFQSPYTST